MESSSPMFEPDRAELAGGVPIPPPPRARDRDGLSALERKALYRVHTELPAMPASLVVQMKHNVRVRRQFVVGAQRDKLARHTQVSGQHLSRLEFEKDVLAAPADGGDERISQLPIECRAGNVGSDSFEL